MAAATMALRRYGQTMMPTIEQAFTAIRSLGLGQDALDQMFRRALFNIIARNQDDHVKNIAFLMDRQGAWTLAPAYDLSYAYNPDGEWTAQHQMSLGGKRDDFTLADLVAGGKTAGVSPRNVKTMVGEVTDAIRKWRSHAVDSGVRPEHVEDVEKNLRLQIN